MFTQLLTRLLNDCPTKVFLADLARCETNPKQLHFHFHRATAGNVTHGIAIACRQLHNERFGRRQSHGLSATAELLACFRKTLNTT